MTKISLDSSKTIQRVKKFYSDHQLYSDTAIFILVAYISLFSIYITENLPIFPIFDELVTITRVTINLIYLLYIPGFLLIKNYYFEENDILELITLQIATSLASIILLGLIMPDFEIYTIFWFLTILCILYSGITALILIISNFLQKKGKNKVKTENNEN